MTAAHTLQVTVASVAETLFDGAARSLLVPGVQGQMQILPQHAPLIAVLKAGEVVVEDTSGETHTYRIPGGLLEVSHNIATVLIREPESTDA